MEGRSLGDVFTLCEGTAYRALQQMGKLTYFHHQTFKRLCDAIPNLQYIERPNFNGRDWYGMIELGAENPIRICIPWQPAKPTESDPYRPLQVYQRGDADPERIPELTLRVAKEWARQFRESNRHLPIPLYVANL
jgi:hypothetical protein